MEHSKVQGTSEQDDLWFSIEENGNKWKVTIPRELLDDETSDDAPLADRMIWVESNIQEIMRTVEAKAKGGFHNKRFENIKVEDIN